MIRKQILSFVLLCAISVTSVAQNKQPNILFIAIDDMNDWTGFLGGHPEAITPNMDKIAEAGVNFTNAHISAPGCSPSRNSLLYGIEPHNSGLYPFYDHEIHQTLMEQYTSLPRLLKENGYLTYGAGKIHHGNLQDPREWNDYYDNKKNHKKFRAGEGYIKGNNGKYSFRPTINPDEEHVDHQVANYGIQKLQEKHDKPFFLAVGIVKPHLPFDAPARFFDQLPDDIQLENFKEDDENDIPKVGKSLMKKGEYNHYKSKNVWGDVRKAYLASISWADYNIGRVLEALENSDYADNTIVIIWSDHGFHLGEKKTFKKFTLWEEATRVPFIMLDTRIQNQPKGRTYDEPVSTINLYKTMAAYANVKVPEYADGESLVRVMEDQSTRLKNPVITSWGRGNYAVRTKDFRYIRYFDGGEELYDHTNDPNEWSNLANASELQELKNELKSYLPKNEKPMVTEHVNVWSIEGADKAKYRGKPVKQEKKSKKAKQN